MALIKCPNCGKEISDDESKCPYCDFILKQESQEENIQKEMNESGTPSGMASNTDADKECQGEQGILDQDESTESEASKKIDDSIKEKTQLEKNSQPESKNRKIGRGSIIGIVAVVVVIAAVVIYFGTGNMRAYNAAQSTMDQGDYEEAKQAFIDLGDYKDSTDKIDECNYQIALRYIDEEDYSKAVDILDELAKTDYKDSNEKIQLCNYQMALQEFEKGDYSSAAKDFSNLAEADYEDSGEWYKKANYELGKQYIEKESYSDAMSCLQNLKYEDSEELYKKATYELGKQYLEKGSYDEAIKCLKDLNYEDSEELVDSIENGETTLNKFIERYNAMADIVSEKQNVTIGKLDAENVKDGEISTSTGATLTFNKWTDDENIDYRYDVDSFMWDKTQWVFIDSYKLTADWYCCVAGYIPDSTYESIGTIVTSMVNGADFYGSTRYNGYFFSTGKTQSELSLSGRIE